MRERTIEPRYKIGNNFFTHPDPVVKSVKSNELHERKKAFCKKSLYIFLSFDFPYSIMEKSRYCLKAYFFSLYD